MAESQRSPLALTQWPWLEELRALAEDVIEVQQREIEFLRRWLAEHPEQ